MSNKKVYVHYEPSGQGACTECVPVTAGSTVLEVLAQFKTKTDARGFSIPKAAAYLTNEDGDALLADDLILSTVGNKADVFVLMDSKKVAASSAAVCKAPPAASSAKAVPSKAAQPQVSLDQVVVAAEHLFVERSFKKLRELSSQVIKDKVGGKAEFNIQALACRARLENHKFSEALQAATRMAQLDDTSYLAHYLCGKAYLGLEDHEEALLELQRAVSFVGGKSKSAADVSADQDKHAIQEIDIRVAEAEALFGLSKHVEAADKLNYLMSNPRMKADDHLPTLLLYAKICLIYAKWSDCVRSLLRAIAANQNDRTAKKLLVEALKCPDGFKELAVQIPSGPQSGSVFAFLGVIARDESAFALGIRLLGMALEGHPQNANFALTLIHLHESNNDLVSALEVMKRFLINNSSARVTYGAKQLHSGFSCGELANVIDLALNSTLGAIASSDIIRWNTTEDDAPTDPTAPSDPNSGYGEVLSADGSAVTRTHDPTLGGAAAATDATLDLFAIAFTAVKILYVRGQLAYLPQIIRVVEPSRRDYQKVLKTSVHETSIRNEHAYYLCIVQACAVHCERQLRVDEAAAKVSQDDPLLIDRWLRNRPENIAGGKVPNDNVIYVVGDSHCMSPAWSTINVQAGQVAPKTYTLVPKLVTGLKHWHLRPESRFYPKASFWSTMASIADGSKVIFMLGEIDCREGLLRAVEKDAYPNLESSMKRTSGIFADVLKSIIKSKPNLKVFIHPIVPVLDPTRKIVIKYNTVLRKAVSTIRGVVWIDIFEEMLRDPIREANHTGINIVGGESVDVLKLKESFQFDGTHIHPNYVPLLLEPFLSSQLA